MIHDLVPRLGFAWKSYPDASSRLQFACGGHLRELQGSLLPPTKNTRHDRVKPTQGAFQWMIKGFEIGLALFRKRNRGRLQAEHVHGACLRIRTLMLTNEGETMVLKSVYVVL